MNLYVASANITCTNLSTTMPPKTRHAAKAAKAAAAAAATASPSPPSSPKDAASVPIIRRASPRFPTKSNSLVEGENNALKKKPRPTSLPVWAGISDPTIVYTKGNTTYAKPTTGVDTVFHVIYPEQKNCLSLSTSRDKRNTLLEYLEARGTSLPSYPALRKSKDKSKREAYYLVGINKKTLPPIPKGKADEYYGSILAIIKYHEKPFTLSFRRGYPVAEGPWWHDVGRSFTYDDLLQLARPFLLESEQAQDPNSESESSKVSTNPPAAALAKSHPPAAANIPPAAASAKSHRPAAASAKLPGMSSLAQDGSLFSSPETVEVPTRKSNESKKVLPKLKIKAPKTIRSAAAKEDAPPKKGSSLKWAIELYHPNNQAEAEAETLRAKFLGVYGSNCTPVHVALELRNPFQEQQYQKSKNAKNWPFSGKYDDMDISRVVMLSSSCELTLIIGFI